MPEDRDPLIVRPVVADAIKWDGNRDAINRKVPRKFAHISFLRVPGIAAAFKDIPSDFWTLDVSEDGYSEAIVACPCGHSPHVEMGFMVQCECERTFVFIGAYVMVANSPKP